MKSPIRCVDKTSCSTATEGEGLYDGELLGKVCQSTSKAKAKIALPGIGEGNKRKLPLDGAIRGTS
jgi:hypothetical protein